MKLYELWSMTEAETSLRVVMLPPNAEDCEAVPETETIFDGNSCDYPYRLGDLMECEVLGVGCTCGTLTYWIRKGESKQAN